MIQDLLLVIIALGVSFAATSFTINLTFIASLIWFTAILYYGFTSYQIVIAGGFSLLWFFIKLSFNIGFTDKDPQPTTN